jgi:hypothetical protein
MEGRLVQHTVAREKGQMNKQTSLWQNIGSGEEKENLMAHNCSVVGKRC